MLVENPHGQTLAVSVNSYLARRSGIEGLLVKSHVTFQLLPANPDDGKCRARLIVKWDTIEAKRGLAAHLRPAIHKFVKALEAIDLSGFKVVPESGDRQFSTDLSPSKVREYLHPELGRDRIIKDGKFRRWISVVADSEDTLITALSRVLAAQHEPIRANKRQVQQSNAEATHKL